MEIELFNSITPLEDKRCLVSSQSRGKEFWEKTFEILDQGSSSTLGNMDKAKISIGIERQWEFRAIASQVCTRFGCRGDVALSDGYDI